MWPNRHERFRCAGFLRGYSALESASFPGFQRPVAPESDVATAQYLGSLCRALVCNPSQHRRIVLITPPLAVLAAAFLVRIFIIFHDCGHGSFYASRSANRIVGFITGLLTLTLYHHWRWQHALHHGTSGRPDRRGAGDIWMLTAFKNTLMRRAGGGSPTDLRAIPSFCSSLLHFMYLSFIIASRHRMRPGESGARFVG